MLQYVVWSMCSVSRRHVIQCELISRISVWRRLQEREISQEGRVSWVNLPLRSDEVETRMVVSREQDIAGTISRSSVSDHGNREFESWWSLQRRRHVSRGWRWLDVSRCVSVGNQYSSLAVLMGLISCQGIPIDSEYSRPVERARVQHTRIRFSRLSGRE